MKNITCSVYASNLVEPVKVNSKYVMVDENLNKAFKDTEYYKELNSFNNEMLRELDSYSKNYVEKKDKTYENRDYFEKVYTRKPKPLFENDINYAEGQYIRPLIPQRSYFIRELEKKK